MDPVVLRNFRDSYVNENKPNRNFNSLARLKARNDTGDRMYIYLFWGKPMPEGVTIPEAELTLWNAKDFTGDITVTAKPITEKWGGNRVNWNNRPAVGAGSASVSHTDADAGTAWILNVKDFMQDVANGTPWYGVRIAVNGTGVKAFHSSQSSEPEYRPMVTMTWNDDPEPPESLSPDGNRAVSTDKPVLTYIFSDPSGDNELARHRIQISTDVTFTVVDWDSGWLDTSVPELDLSTSTYPGLADGASVYWRAAVEDSSGGQSEFSDPAQFSRANKGTFAVGALTDDGDGTWSVQDSTPTIIWSLTGRTQSAYRVRIENISNPDLGQENGIYDTGRLTGTENSVDTGAESDRVIGRTADTYRLRAWLWDTIDREKTPGDETYYYYEEDFNYTPGATSAPTGLIASLDEPWPWVKLDFARSSTPDGFTVIRDNEVIEANLDPADLWQGGTAYRYIDRTAAPRVSHEWRVVANVNDEDSPPTATVSTQTQPHFTWMMNPDGTSPIVLVKSASEPTPAVDAASSSFQEVHQPIGGAPPVLITQFISGYEGRVDAVLSDGIVAGLSARQMRDRFKRWKRNPGTEVLLYMVDEVMRVVPMNMSYRPRAKGGGKIIYDVSFDFFQVDY